MSTVATVREGLGRVYEPLTRRIMSGGTLLRADSEAVTVASKSTSLVNRPWIFGL